MIGGALAVFLCIVLGVYFATQSGSSTPSSDTSSTPPISTTPPATTPATTPPSGAGTTNVPSSPLSTPPSTTYTTYANTDCFSGANDLGYQGVITAAQIQAACSANSQCAGAVQHGGGDWWLLKSVHANSGVGGSPGNQCIVAPGKSLS